MRRACVRARCGQSSQDHFGIAFGPHSERERTLTTRYGSPIQGGPCISTGGMAAHADSERRSDRVRIGTRHRSGGDRCGPARGPRRQERDRRAAVDAMRSFLGDVDIAGMVVIGEGEKDEAPMLYIGEYVGTGDGPALDVAVDPIDGTTLASRGGAGAIAVVAAARRGSLFHSHVAYMDKIVTGPAGRGVSRSIVRSARTSARWRPRSSGPSARSRSRCSTGERNAGYLAQCREIGARVHISATATSRAGDGGAPGRHRIDMLAGIGGAPEGVVTAVAVKALGGEMQGPAVAPRRARTRARGRRGPRPRRVLTLDRLCAADDGFFAATGVTDGDFLARRALRAGLCLYAVADRLDDHALRAHARHAARFRTRDRVRRRSSAPRHVGARAVAAYDRDARR